MNRPSNKFFRVIAYSLAINKTKGVAIICRRNLHFELLGTWSDNEGRIAIAKIHIENRDIALDSIYAPNAFDRGFYDLATKSLLDLTGFKLTIGADFNAVMDHSIDMSGQSESLDQRMASEALRALATNTGVVDLWRIMNPTARDFTHLSARHKSFSQIDFILASKDIFHKIKDVGLLPVTLSDHKAVVCLASLRAAPSRAPRWPFSVTLLCDESFKSQFTAQLKDFLNVNKGSVDDPRILWDATKGFIRNNATLFTPPPLRKLDQPGFVYWSLSSRTWTIRYNVILMMVLLLSVS